MKIHTSSKIENRWTQLEGIKECKGPLYQYLRCSNLKGLIFPKYLEETIKLVWCDGKEKATLAFALRSQSGHLTNILYAELNRQIKTDHYRLQRRWLLTLATDVAGSSVHFGEPDLNLGVALGIESALGIVSTRGLPCWACLGATGLRTLQVPPRVRTVQIFADIDSVEVSEAVCSLTNRLEANGLKVEITSYDQSGAVARNSKI